MHDNPKDGTGPAPTNTSATTWTGQGQIKRQKRLSRKTPNLKWYHNGQACGNYNRGNVKGYSRTGHENLSSVKESNQHILKVSGWK
jgi:hypothetical protein